MTQSQRVTRQSKQSGGTFLGVVLGLTVGLVIAAVVAVYVTRAPSPFAAKNASSQAASEPGAGEAQFDPNRMLQGHAASQPAASAPVSEPPIVVIPPANSGNGSENGVAQGVNGTDNAASGAAVPEHAHATHAAPSRAASAATAKKPAKPTKPVKPGESASTAHARLDYSLQAGSYKTSSDAEQQRARLALQGVESRLVPHKVNGVTYYRVRIGPFAKPEDMNTMRQRLSDAGIHTSVISGVRHHNTSNNSSNAVTHQP